MASDVVTFVDALVAASSNVGMPSARRFAASGSATTRTISQLAGTSRASASEPQLGSDRYDLPAVGPVAHLPDEEGREVGTGDPAHPPVLVAVTLFEAGPSWRMAARTMVQSNVLALTSASCAV